MRSRFASLALIAALAVAGCGTFVTPTYLSDTPPEMSARAPRSVRIYASGPPARPYVDVALLRVDQTHGLNDQGTDVLLARLREQAGAMGCDGVVLGGTREHVGTHGHHDVAAILDPGLTILDATCILFPEDHRPRFAAAPAVVDGVASTRQNVDLEMPR
jgi:hypothetical protein